MIEIRDLHKTYPDGHVALSGVDLSIDRGVLGLLGPNGAGKTTFLSILVLLLEPTRGERHYWSLDPAKPKNRPTIRKRIGFLPQDYSPLPWLDGFEYLVHCARIRATGMTIHQIEERAKRLLDAVDLTQAARRQSGTYSGGMKRRLGIAQALIHAPQLVVVDEPTAGLDPEERIHFRNLVGEIGEATNVILSTHISEDIEATCSRIAIITGGRVQYDGSPAAMMQKVHGRLWDVDAAHASGTIVSEYVESGERRAVVLNDRSVENSRQARVTLELAYSTFLAEQDVA